jgi:hypothetical protein
LKPLARLTAFAAVLTFFVMLAGTALPATAAPVSLTINGSAVTAQSFPVNTTVLVVATYTDETSAFVLTSSNATSIGFFTAGGASIPVGSNNDGQTITGNDPTMPTVITVTDDADGTSETTVVQVFFFCAGPGTTNISFTQAGGTSTVIAVTCTGATTTISFSNSAPAIGTAITVTATCTAAGQALTSTPTTSGAFGTTPITNGTWVSASQVNCAAAGTMTAPYTCAVAGTVTFTLNAVTNSITCAGTTGGLLVSGTTGYTATVSGTCVAGAVLTQTGPAYFSTATLNGVVITTGVAAGSIPCTAAGTIIATLVCNTTGTVSLALGAATGTFVCNSTSFYGGGAYNPYLNYNYNNCATGYNGTYNAAFPYNYNTAYPYNQQYATNNCYNQQQYTNVPTSLTLATASPSVACGSNVSVTVRVVGTNGMTVADGTSVALAASVGTLSPASASTVGGAVTATYTAPANVPATSVTLRATAGSASNTTGVSVTCTQATAPAASQPSAPPPSYSPPAPPSGLVIAPPNTGDGGLLVNRDDVNCDD